MFYFFFFNDTATTEIYTLSLHDALPIWGGPRAHRLHIHPSPLLPGKGGGDCRHRPAQPATHRGGRRAGDRSEEHTSELQSQSNLVCRLLLEKKKKYTTRHIVADIVVIIR